MRGIKRFLCKQFHCSMNYKNQNFVVGGGPQKPNSKRMRESESVSGSIVSDSLWPHGL